MKQYLRNKAGFTLVELIVVIAILGILAGIGTVGYSGYVKKAHQAADETLLAAVNRAFAAACIEGGNQWPANAEAKLTEGEKTIQFVKSDVDTEGTVFFKYYRGNEDSAFKYYTNLAYNRATGSFKGATVSSSTENGVTTYNYNIDGVTYVVTDEQLNAIKTSTYGTKMTMDQLMGDVTGMVDAMNSALGGGSMLAGFLTQDGLSLADWGVTAAPGTDEYKAQLSNAAVLYVAKNTTADTASTLIAALNDGNINSLMSGNNMLTNMAGLYGIATGFAHSDAAVGWETTVDGQTYNASEYYDYVNSKIAAVAESTEMNQSQKMQGIMNALNLMTAYVYNTPGVASSGMTNEFTSYKQVSEGAKTSQLEDDANGFVNAMLAITANSDSLVSSGAVQEGFGSGDIGAVLNVIFSGGFN